MKSVYIVGGAIAVIAWLAVGLVIARGPQPEIIVPAEKLTSIGPLNITNTLLTAWVVMVVLIVSTWLATRAMKLMPGGFQNFVEAIVGYVADQIEEIAGEVNGRRFFAVVATFFFFIIVANWFALLPFFNAIGNTEDVGHEVFHEISSTSPDKLKLTNGKYEEDHKFAAFKMDKSGGIAVVKPQGKAVDFTVAKDATPGEALDGYIVFLAHQFAGLKASEEEQLHPPADLVREAANELEKSNTAPKLLFEEPAGAHTDEHTGPVTSPTLGRQVFGVDFSQSKKLALVIPWFRSVYSDVNNTLALGFCSFIIVEFWGLQTLGLGYLKKFFNFSSPINAFVGFLELLSEFIRIISFAFRLFGNIFAGEVLILMLTFLMPFLFVDIIYGLELFVGFIQAAVFALLTLVFAVMAVEHHGDEEHHEGGGHGDGHGAEAPHTTGAAQAH